VLGLVARHTGVVPAIDFAPPQPGDVRATGGSIDRAERLLGWTPRTSLNDGIARHVAAVRSGEVDLLGRSEELDVTELESPVA
jgi:nucleoside-diphosphate-sugar epimerase